METGPLLYEAYIVTGKVKHVFVEHPLESIHPQAGPAAQAALCASRQSAQAFWDMHELLFERVEDWSSDQAVERFKEYAAELGLDKSAFATCLDSGEMAAQVQSELEYGTSVGVGGVPAFFVNDWFLNGAQPYAAFEQAIEAALKGEHPPPTPTPLPEGATWFDVNPQQPGRTYTGDVTIGPADAKLVLLEFLDFKSGANGAYFQDQWPGLLADYVDTGKVRVIFKYFPPTDDVQATKAAYAAECAADQGAFLAMHDVLLSDQSTWGTADDISTVLKEYAAELGLDAAAFATCLEANETAEKVAQDIALAERNTLEPPPQLVVLYQDQAGIVPVEQIRTVFDQLLAQ